MILWPFGYPYYITHSPPTTQGQGYNCANYILRHYIRYSATIYRTEYLRLATAPKPYLYVFEKKYKIFCGIVQIKKTPERAVCLFWCRMSDLNQRPSDYKSDALPAELIRQCSLLYIVVYKISSPKIHKKLALFK